jgi:predicted peptidase
MLERIKHAFIYLYNFRGNANMIKGLKKHLKTTMLLTLTTGAAISFGTGVIANEVNSKSPSYQTVTKIEDWGAAITKVIVNLGEPVPVNSITRETFKVHVARSDSRLETPFLGEGDRKVTKAYVSDENGTLASEKGNYVVLEMEIGPELALSSALNYDFAGTQFNDWTDNTYTITQLKDIETSTGSISGLVVDSYTGGVRELVDEFSTGSATYDDVTLTYADYAPAEDEGKNPLVIWLHGMGEGGTDPTIAISGNKAANFASEDIQSYFDGAYVLAPQTPTWWMEGYTGFGDGTSTYQEALMALIEDYVDSNDDIDTSRIYIGGDSNGGYMTMLMIRNYTDYFAAAFPTCEALPDALITDAEIERIKDLPIWFIAAENDPVVDVNKHVVPTYNRLIEAGAKDVHLSLFENVIDTTGLYKKEDGTPYEYNGHWSWIYVYNNEVSEDINGEEMTLMEWVAGQSKESVTFTDISNHWAKEDIEYLANRSVISGFLNGTFAPNANISRAEAAAIIVRELGLTLDNPPNFEDVTQGHWAAGYIGKAAKAGIMSGYGNGKFKPSKPLTREEMAAILVRAYELTGTSTVTFSDVNKGSWSYPYIETLVANNITKGLNDHTFAPKQNVTRAEFATMVTRVIKGQ